MCMSLKHYIRFFSTIVSEKTECSTINTYRLALSAYHDKEDYQPVGNHPKNDGSLNNNPPKPRYVFIWDIEQVLTFIRRMLNNTYNEHVMIGI